MKRILFVDDDSNILAGLCRSLRSLRNEWEMVFAEGSAAALRGTVPPVLDVVVSDARMPGMEGSAFLGEVMRLYPDTVGIILSGQCSRTSVLKCVEVAHQFLSKPCEAGTLKSAVHEVCAMRLFPTCPPGRRSRASNGCQVKRLYKELWRGLIPPTFPRITWPRSLRGT